MHFDPLGVGKRSLKKTNTVAELLKSMCRKNHTVRMTGACGSPLHRLRTRDRLACLCTMGIRLSKIPSGPEPLTFCYLLPRSRDITGWPDGGATRSRFLPRERRGKMLCRPEICRASPGSPAAPRPQRPPAPAGVGSTPAGSVRARFTLILQVLETGGLFPALKPSTLNINQIRI